MVGENNRFAIDAITVSSPSFKNGDYIPVRFTCDGENINPAIHFTGIPAGTKSVVLILDDPDAPKGTFNHWLMWNISPSGMIAENSAPGVQGKNGSGKKAYKGPCPPEGSGIHHYRFKIFALDATLDLGNGEEESDFIKTELENAIKTHLLAQGELVGLYQNKSD